MNRRQELRDSIAYVSALVNDLHEEHRDAIMSDEVRASFEEGLAAVEQWNEELKELEERDRKVAGLPTVPASTPNVIVRDSAADLYDVRSVFVQNAGARPHVLRTALRDRALAVLERNADEFRESAHLDRVDALLRSRRVDPTGSLAVSVIATANPDYARAFAQVVTGTDVGLLPEEERSALERAVSVGTSNAGGYAVPTYLDPTVIHTHSGTVNPIRDLANVRTLPMGNTWTGFSHGGVTAQMNGEASETTEGSPTYAQPSISVKKGEAYAEYSDESLQDIDGLVEDLMFSFAEAKDVLEATQFTTGSGSGNNTRGIVTALVADTTPVSSASTDTFVAADMYALRRNVPNRYRPAAGFSWLMNQAIADLVRQFGSAVNHAFTTDFTADGVERVLGRPVFEVSDMDEDITGSGENYLVIGGNIRAAYTIVDKIGMTAKRNPLVIDTANNLPNGQEGIYVSWRFGGDVVNPAAARILNVT